MTRRKRRDAGPFARWTKEEDKKLRAVYFDHDNKTLVGMFHDRTSGAIGQRASNLGLINTDAKKRRKMELAQQSRHTKSNGTVTLITGKAKPKPKRNDTIDSIEEIVQATVIEAVDNERERIVEKLQAMVDAL